MYGHTKTVRVLESILCGTLLCSTLTFFNHISTHQLSILLLCQMISFTTFWHTDVPRNLYDKFILSILYEFKSKTLILWICLFTGCGATYGTWHTTTQTYNNTRPPLFTMRLLQSNQSNHCLLYTWSPSWASSSGSSSGSTVWWRSAGQR